jgi:hypothetical protein
VNSLGFLIFKRGLRIFWILSVVSSRTLNAAKFASSLSSIKFWDDGYIFSLNSANFQEDNWRIMRQKVVISGKEMVCHSPLKVANS